MKLFFIAIIFLFSIINYSFAQIQGRFDAVCGYLSQGIYCFGGATGFSENPVSDSTINYLDIVNNSGLSTEELGTKWVTVTPITKGIDIKARDFAQSMALPDGNTMLLSGGWNSGGTKLVYQTITYNAKTNVWAEHPNYEETPFGNRQIYWASSVYVPEYGVGFYGGQETYIDKTWTYQGQNMSQYDDPVNNRRNIGYTNLTFFDITSSFAPWYSFPIQNNLPAHFSRSQTSILDHENYGIFFFGGRYLDSTTMAYIYYNFESVMTFNLTTGNWGTQNLTGQIPKGRVYHTTTLLESTKRDVLLYGGNNGDDGNRAILNYCYTLNLDTYEWKQQNIAATKGVALIRTRHSAISVNKNTVFILFGKNEADVPVSSVVPLNVTDPSNISYLESYVDPSGVPRSNNSTNNSTNSGLNDDLNNSSGLSTGATAGIAVGSVVGVLIICGILFCFWKNNNDKKKKLEIEEISKKNEIIEPPVREVDWEEIDKHNGEYHMNYTGNLRYSPQLTNDSTAVADNKSEIYSQSQTLIKPDLELQRLNAVEDNIPSPIMKLQKPDGGL